MVRLEGPLRARQEVARCGAARRGMARRGVARHGAVWRGAAWRGRRAPAAARIACELPRPDAGSARAKGRAPNRARRRSRSHNPAPSRLRALFHSQGAGRSGFARSDRRSTCSRAYRPMGGHARKVRNWMFSPRPSACILPASKCRVKQPGVRADSASRLWVCASPIETTRLAAGRVCCSNDQARVLGHLWSPSSPFSPMPCGLSGWPGSWPLSVSLRQSEIASLPCIRRQARAACTSPWRSLLRSSPLAFSSPP